MIKLFISKGLIQAETTVRRKASTWSKGNKDGNKIKLELFFMMSLFPEKVLVNYSIAVFRKNISTVWLCKEINIITTT